MTMISDNVGFVVRCGGCGGLFHELTANFREVPPMRGDYLHLRKEHRENGWYAFPEHDWVVGDNVMCPQCGTPYTMERVLFLLREAGIGDRKIQGSAGQANVEGSASGNTLDQAEEEASLHSGGDDSDSRGLYDNADFSGDSSVGLVSSVMGMTREGKTQSFIAETCQISVYMVRQIQNGKKV